MSPAKTLDMEADAASAGGAPTKPRLAAQTRTLAGELRDYSPKRLEKLMSISAKLAGLNAERWQDFGTRGNPRHQDGDCPTRVVALMQLSAPSPPGLGVFLFLWNKSCSRP